MGRFAGIKGGAWDDDYNDSDNDIIETAKTLVEQRENRVTSEDIKFIFEVMKKEAPYDSTSIKQLFYGCSSAFTKLPIHHNVNSRKSGSGKSYLLTLVAGYYPNKYVLSFVGMSDKALVHEQGIQVLVDEETGNTVFTDPIIDDFKKKIENLEAKLQDPKFQDSKSKKGQKQQKEFRNQIKQCEKEIKDIYKKCQKLIILDNRIILLLDTAQESLYNTLMSLISQDTGDDQLYQFTDKQVSGKLSATKNRLRGTPTLFTTQVVDDSKQLRYQEKNRRFIHVTPDTSNEKVSSAKRLIGQRYSLLPEEYDKFVVDKANKIRAKEIVSILVDKLIDHSKLIKHKESGVKITFWESISYGIGGDDTEWSMTVMDRLMRYLSVITKINMDSRPRIVNTETGAFYPISIFADLKETLTLMEMAGNALRPYIANWYNKAFLTGFREQEEPNPKYDNSGNVIERETYRGLTTEQLAYWTHKNMNLTLGLDDIRNQFIYPLRNMGIVNTTKSVLNGNEIICYPVEEGNIFSIFHNDKDFRLKVDSEYYPSRYVIAKELRTFIKHDVDEGSEKNKNKNKNKKYSLLDHEGNEITILELIDRYLCNPELCFINEEKEYEAKAIILSRFGYYPTRPAQKEKNNFSTSSPRRVLSEIPKNDIEESAIDTGNYDSMNPKKAPQTPQIKYEHKGTSFYAGKWHCQNCGLSGDKFFMQGKECNNNC